MPELPPVRYTKAGGDSIAYRDCGGSGTPLLYLGTNGSHQDLIWDEPGYAHFLKRLTDLGRLITFDRRGSGLSSHVTKPTIEVRVADIEAVLDAVGVDAAIAVASVGSTQTALAWAASRPERCQALVLFAPTARISEVPGYLIGIPSQGVQATREMTESTWGTGITALIYTPTLVDSPEFVAWCARMERSVATPVEATEWVEMYDETDVRDVLPHVYAPVLVVTPMDTGEYAPPQSRFVAEHLRHAREVEIVARDQWPFGDGMAQFLDAIADFLADLDVAPVASGNRRLAAVLFTDIVASTEQLQAAGDRQWRATLESHDEIAGRVVARHAGRVVKSTGDGAMAVFDGPAGAVVAALEFIRACARIGLAVRAGVHVGELEERGDDVAGIAVHLCSRIADRAAAGEVLVTTTVRDLVAGSGLRFETRGPQTFKGFDDPVEILSASTAHHG